MIDAHRLENHSEEAADLLSAMGNQKRMMILCNLAGGEMQVGMLAEKVDLSQSALSQHLAKLRTRQLVKTRREAQAVYYSINSEPVLQMLRTLSSIYCNCDSHLVLEPEANRDTGLGRGRRSAGRHHPQPDENHRRPLLSCVPTFGWCLRHSAAGFARAAMAFSSVSVVTNSALMARWKPGFARDYPRSREADAGTCPLQTHKARFRRSGL